MSENECIFCKIINGNASGNILYQDNLVTAFRDIHPVAPLHILILPNKHIASINDLNAEDEIIAGRLLITARKLAVEYGVQDTGYRLIVNTGSHGGQVVFHLHIHLIGGQKMRFLMG